MAVFDPMTGETHLLNELPVLILGALNDEPKGISDLIQCLAGTIRLRSVHEQQIAKTLTYLESAGLAESRVVSAA